jgi:hypothetical protein
MANSLFRPGENCCAAAHARRATMLVDGSNYFDAFRSRRRACREVDPHPGVGLRQPHGAALRRGRKPPDAGRVPERPAAAKNRKLRIDILDWDFPMVYGTDREYSPIFGLDWKPHRHIRFRFDDTHPLAGSHHQKIVVFDDKVAFAGGLDLTNSAGTSPDALPNDPRRTFEDEPYPPFHDVMIAVDGEAARELDALARKRWKAATGHKLKPVSVDGDPWPPEQRVDIQDVRVGIACTIPPSKAAPRACITSRRSIST